MKMKSGGKMRENEIKSGEFIRTIDGKIGIFDRYSSRNQHSFYKSPFNCFIKLQKRKTPLQCARAYIKSHNERKIKLIEVGDYINGQKITKITKDPFVKDQIDLWTDRTIPFDGDYQQERFIESEIETILTKEEFEANIDWRNII